MSVLRDLPWYVQALGLFLLLVVTGVVARSLTLRASAHGTAPHVDHPRLILSSVASSLALLIGFGVMITWGGISAAQTATEAEAVAARQVAWAVELNSGQVSDSLPQVPVRATMTALQAFLESSADSSHLTVPADVAMEGPNDVSMRSFQRAVRGLIYDTSVAPAQAASIQAAADALAAAEADSQAIADRRLPDLFLILIIVNAMLLAAIQGVILAENQRPWTGLAWALVVALAVTVVLQMDGPFTGDISANRQSLADVATWIGAGGP